MVALKHRISRLERQRMSDSQQIDGFVTLLYDLTPDEERTLLIEMGEDLENTVYVDIDTGERIVYNNA